MYKRFKRTYQARTKANLLTSRKFSTNIEMKKRRNKENNIERKRVSFDLRTDLHKQLKMQALVQDKKIYILIEEALEKYLGEKL
ncbi:hypothetical protein [Peribacillus asahii]|uniref:hypothetical protein n=1 Tax=Peribacillus asahii TaxID=228899 RepID=UPI003818A756